MTRRYLRVPGIRSSTNARMPPVGPAECVLCKGPFLPVSCERAECPGRRRSVGRQQTARLVQDKGSIGT